MRLMLITDLKMFSNKSNRKPVGEGNPTGLFFKNAGKQITHRRLPSRRQESAVQLT